MAIVTLLQPSDLSFALHCHDIEVLTTHPRSDLRQLSGLGMVEDSVAVL